MNQGSRWPSRKTFARSVPGLPNRHGKTHATPKRQPCKPHASQNVTARTGPCQSVTAKSVPANLTAARSVPAKRLRTPRKDCALRKICDMQESCQGEGAKGNGAVRQRGWGRPIFSARVPSGLAWLLGSPRPHCAIWVKGHDPPHFYAQGTVHVVPYLGGAVGHIRARYGPAFPQRYCLLVLLSRLSHIFFSKSYIGTHMHALL